jgi:hypothetical protein
MAERSNISMHSPSITKRTHTMSGGVDQTEAVLLVRHHLDLDWCLCEAGAAVAVGCTVPSTVPVDKGRVGRRRSDTLRTQTLSALHTITQQSDVRRDNRQRKVEPR